MAFDQMNLNKGMPSWIQNLLDNHSVDAWSEDPDAQECSNKPATAKYQGKVLIGRIRRFLTSETRFSTDHW